MNYKALVTTIHTRSLAGSDNIQLGNCLNYQVIVSKEVADGSLGIFFEAETQLSEEFAVIHDLVRRKDAEGNVVPTSGFFESNRRVKALKLRGAKSEGFFVPISYFEYTSFDLSTLKEGDQFDELNDHKICQKYYTPKTLRAMRNRNSQPKKENRMFHKHVDTEQLKRVLPSIPSGALIYISTKLHGTCVTSSTKIRMADGTKKTISTIVKGDYVLGLDSTNTLVPTKVLNSWNHGKASKWLKISCLRKALGHGDPHIALTCTPEHLIWTKDNGYVEAQYLTDQDQVLVCRNSQSLTEVQSQILLGKLLGDGSLTCIDAGARVEFGHKKDHEEYVDWTLKGLQDLANSTKQYQVSGFGTQMVRGQSKPNYYVKELFKPFTETGIKQIPKWVINFASPLALAFWYMDDGSLSHSEAQEDRVSIATCGFDLDSCNNLVQMLLRFGVESKVTSHIDRSKPRNRIEINATNAEKFFLLVAPYVPPVMQYKLPQRYRGHSGWLPSSESTYKPSTGWVSVVSVLETFPSSKKYDLETETGNFLAQDILVHNSHRLIHGIDESPIVYKGLKKYLAKWFKWPQYKSEWAHIHGTRNVVLDNSVEKLGYYGNHDFRFKTLEGINLNKGECIYGEIVGYTTSNQPIMTTQSTESLKDKAVVKKFGKHIEYKYGQLQGQAKFYVYRITQVNEDGQAVELSWPQVVGRCRQLNLETVPFLESFIFDGDHEALQAKVDSYVNGEDGIPASVLDPTHLEEGVVVRVETEDGTNFYKAKNFLFLCLEGVARESEDFVDPEEVS